MRKRLLSFSLAILMVLCTVVGTLPEIKVSAAEKAVDGVVSIVAEVDGKDSLDNLKVGDVVTVKVVLPDVINTRKLQLDLNYDKSRFEYNGDADATPITSVLTIGDVRTIDDSIIRLVAAGMNNASFSAGTVAVVASFTVISGENLGELDAFSLSNFICGDAGVSIDNTPVKATVKGKDSPIITVSNATVEQGGTVSVTVDLSRNEGITGMLLKVGYDSALTITNVSKGKALSSLTFAGAAKPYANPLTLSWDGMSDDKTTGNLVTITFSVPKDAKVGNYPISITYNAGDVFDENFNDIVPVINNGNIEVTEAHVCSFGNWTKYDDTYHIHSCSCGESEKAVHVWNSGVVTTKPTCTAKGEKTYTCVDCNATKTEEMVSLGHDVIEHNAKAPTCTEIGWDAYETCSRCDYTTYNELKALGHSYGEWDVTDAATCTETGTERRDCANCDHYETRTVDALGHDVVKHNAKAPTCTEIGWDSYETCSRCDYTTYNELKALGHSYGEWDVTDAATCTETGTERRDCANCDHYETRTVDALGHDVVKHNAKAPTCTEIGWDAYETCSRCDYTTYNEIKPLEHAYSSVVTPPTSTEKGYTTHTCSKCGDSYVDSYVDPIVDENAPTITVSTSTGRAGGTVDVTISLDKNSGITGAILSVEYDPAFTLTKVAKGDALGSLTFADLAVPYLNPLTLSWDGISDDNVNGTLVTLTFEIPEGMEAGEYPIKVTYKSGDIYNANLDDVAVVINDGGIKVTDITYGDVNGDGVINGKDLTLIRRHITGGFDLGAFTEAAADVNLDGVINGKDLTLIRRFITGGFGVELGK